MRHSVRLKSLKSQLSTIEVSRRVGRIIGVHGGVLHVSGLDKQARIGDRAEVTRSTGVLKAEVVQLLSDGIVLLPDEAVDGVALSDRVTLRPGGTIAPSQSWVGRIVDPD